MKMNRLAALAAAASICMIASACDGDSFEGGGAPSPTEDEEVSTEVVAEETAGEPTVTDADGDEPAEVSEENPADSEE